MTTEILWNIPSHLIGTWHNYIWCWQFTLNKLANSYAIKRKGTEALVTILCGFIDQLVWHSKNFSRYPTPYILEDIHSTELIRILLYAFTPCEFYVSTTWKHLNLGAAFKTAWRLLQPNNLRSLWHWTVSVETFADFLQYWSVTNVQMNTLT